LFSIITIARVAFFKSGFQVSGVRCQEKIEGKMRRVPICYLTPESACGGTPETIKYFTETCQNAPWLAAGSFTESVVDRGEF
jgi:hypothetical protein